MTSTQLSPQRVRLVTIIGGTLVVVGIALLSMRLQYLVTIGNDFTYDYLAAQALRDGRSIYVGFSQADLTAEALGTARPVYYPDTLENIHPPFAAVLFLSVTLLPYDDAILIWTTLSLLLYIWIGYTVLRELKVPLVAHWLVLLIGFALCWYPFQAHIALSPLSIPLVACVIGSWCLLRRRCDLLAGILLGLVCATKLFPALIVLFLVQRRRWRAVGATLGTLALSGLLALLIVGGEDIVRYGLEVAPKAARREGLALMNASLNGVIGRWLIGGPFVRPIFVAPQLASILVVLGGLGLLGFLGWRARHLPPGDGGDDTLFALTCLAMLLLSPITWQHVFPLLALPFGLLVNELRIQPNYRRIALTVLALLFVSLPDVDIARALMRLYEPYRLPWYASLPMLASTAGLLLLFWLVGTQSQATREQLR